MCRDQTSALAVAAVADAHGAMLLAMKPECTVHNGMQLLLLPHKAMLLLMHSPPLLLMTRAV